MGKNKFERQKRCEHQFKKKAGFIDSHHLKPGGSTIPSNLIALDVYRHDAWHLLFGNKSLNEIILLLNEVQKRKEAISFIWSN